MKTKLYNALARIKMQSRTIDVRDFMELEREIEKHSTTRFYGIEAELRNINTVTQHADFEVRITFKSVRAASAFKAAIEQLTKEK